MTREFEGRIQDAIRLLGGTIEQGGKHRKVRFQNGATAVIPGSPSDHRSLMNALKEMERKSGRKLPKRVSGGGRTTHRKPPGFTKTRPSKPSERRLQIQSLQAELALVDAELQKIASSPSPGMEQEFLRLHADWEQIADALAENGQEAPTEWRHRA